MLQNTDLHCKSEIVILTNKFVISFTLFFMCQYNNIFCEYNKKIVLCSQKIMLYWHIKNSVNQMTNLFVKITISFLQCTHIRGLRYC